MFNRYLFKQPILFHALTLLLILTLFGGAAAISMQQVLRRGANQPQIDMANLCLSKMKSGAAPDAVLPDNHVDIERSLEPFLIFYGDDQKPGKTTGYLSGGTPAPPSGVFAYARAHGSNVLTWQPRPGVRIATVLLRVTGAKPGFLLAGRSLRLVEEDEAFLRRIAFAGWFAVAVLVLAGAAFLRRAEGLKPAVA